MAFDFRDLSVPILVAPMAGGPSTPQLAAAGSNAGGLGFIAAGYLAPEAFAERLAATRSQTSGPIGVNLFAPQPSAGSREDIARYATALAREAHRYGTQLGEPRFDDDHWAAKIEVLLDMRPDVASFTFGAPSADECRRLREVGIAVVGTVTTVAEARTAVERGVDAVAAQGPAAGGHRGTFDPAVQPATQTLDELLAEVKAAVDVPVAAAGGLMTAEDVGRVLEAGAVAAQLGTAFLLSDESGSSQVHRAALQNPRFTETVVTRAFSGRYARGLRNRFVDEHEAEATFGYPQIHWLTSPLRAASVRAGDPEAVNVWAGTGYRQARTGSVAEIIRSLT
jgi:nitronate monooxygenase